METWMASEIEPVPLPRIAPPATQPARERQREEARQRKKRKKTPKPDPEEAPAPDEPKGRKIDIRA